MERVECHGTGRRPACRLAGPAFAIFAGAGGDERTCLPRGLYSTRCDTSGFRVWQGVVLNVLRRDDDVGVFVQLVVVVCGGGVFVVVLVGRVLLVEHAVGRRACSAVCGSDIESGGDGGVERERAGAPVLFLVLEEVWVERGSL